MIPLTSKIAKTTLSPTQLNTVLKAVKKHAPKRARGKTAAELAFLIDTLGYDHYVLNRSLADLVNSGLIGSSGCRSLGKVCTIKSRQRKKNIMFMYFYWK